MGGYFASAAVLGAMGLVVVLVGLLQKLNTRYRWSERMRDVLGPGPSNLVMRLGILVAAYLGAGLLQKVGVALPPELQAFLPNQQAAVMAAIVASYSYWQARQRDDAPPGSTADVGEGHV